MQTFNYEIWVTVPKKDVDGVTDMRTADGEIIRHQLRLVPPHLNPEARAAVIEAHTPTTGYLLMKHMKEIMATGVVDLEEVDVRIVPFGR